MYSWKKQGFLRIGAALICVLMLVGCQSSPTIKPIDSLSPTRTPKPVATAEPTPTPVPFQRENPDESTIASRYNVNINFTREVTAQGSFAAYLQNMPLKPAGSDALLYDQTTLSTVSNYKAVLDLPIVDKNNQRAGIIAQLYAQYFYDREEYEKITFSLNNEWEFSFDQWRQGKRPNSNYTGWTSGGTQGDDLQNFRAFMKIYYSLSNAKSIKRDMYVVDPAQPIRIGDVFFPEGEAKRAIVVVDCETNEDGQRYVMLAEGGKPAQDIVVLDNTADANYSPWFLVYADTQTIQLDGSTTLSVQPGENGAVRYSFAEQTLTPPLADEGAADDEGEA